MPAPVRCGGQAVIEGVMMRAQSGTAVAVRRSTGEIVVREQFAPSISERQPLFKLPLLRGVVVLFETLAAGFDALDFSAKQAEIGTADQAETGSDQTKLEPKPAELSQPSSSFGNGLTFAIAILFGIGLFVALPHGLSMLTGKLFGGFALSSPVFHLVAGLFKLGIFIGYIALLSLLPDVRRVFMYHGAEHKVIAAFEVQEPLDVAHARTHTTFHARCGTSFLLVVVVASIVVFAIILPMIGLGEGWDSHVKAVLIKVPLLLPIAALAYELNRFAAEHMSNPVVRMIVTPGFWLQRLTTREPQDDMLEVSITSLKAALKRHQAGAGKASSQISVYRDFAEVESGLR